MRLQSCPKGVFEWKMYLVHPFYIDRLFAIGKLVPPYQKPTTSWGSRLSEKGAINVEESFFKCFCMESVCGSSFLYRFASRYRQKGAGKM